jgi:hypothetical protein
MLFPADSSALNRIPTWFALMAHQLYKGRFPRLRFLFLPRRYPHRPLFWSTKWISITMAN